MGFISESDKTRIEQAIIAIERETKGEIVTVIAKASNRYVYIPIMWAALIALLYPGFVLMLRVWQPETMIYLVQIGIFVFCAAVFNLTPIKMFLVPTSTKHLRASRFALEHFHKNELHYAPGRSGVLIFVSLAEKYVRILADKGIMEKVDEAMWDTAIHDFISFIQDGKVAEGFLATIERCGSILKEHFPLGDGDAANHLPNQLIVDTTQGD